LTSQANIFPQIKHQRETVIEHKEKRIQTRTRLVVFITS
jgi:hypothetical protein